MSESLRSGKSGTDTPEARRKREQERLRFDARQMLKIVASDSIDAALSQSGLSTETAQTYIRAATELQKIVNEAFKKAPMFYPERWDNTFKQAGTSIRPIVWAKADGTLGIERNGIVIPDSPRAFIDELRALMVDREERARQLRARFEPLFQRLEAAVPEAFPGLYEEIRHAVEGLPRAEVAILTDAYDERVLVNWREMLSSLRSIDDLRTAVESSPNMLFSDRHMVTADALLEAAAGRLMQGAFSSSADWADLEAAYVNVRPILDILGSGARGPVYESVQKEMQKKAKDLLAAELRSRDGLRPDAPFFEGLNGMIDEIDAGRLPSNLKSSLNASIEGYMARRLGELIDAAETRADHGGSLADLANIYESAQACRVPRENPLIGRLRSIADMRVESLIAPRETEDAAAARQRLVVLETLIAEVRSAEYIYGEVKERYEMFIRQAQVPLVEQGIATLEAADIQDIRRVRDFAELIPEGNPLRADMLARLDRRIGQRARTFFEQTRDPVAAGELVRALERVGPVSHAAIRYMDAKAETGAREKLSAASSLPAVSLAYQGHLNPPRYPFTTQFEEAHTNAVETKAADMIMKQLRTAKSLVMIGAAYKTAKRYISMSSPAFRKIEAEAQRLIEGSVAQRLRQPIPDMLRRRIFDEVKDTSLPGEFVERMRERLSL